MENRKRLSMRNDEVQQTENKECPKMWFWNATVLELVELVLRPPKGGPPSLTESSDAVFFLMDFFFSLLILLFFLD